jgi:hypothetical protein
MKRLFDRPAFAIGQHRWLWADVLAGAAIRGDLGRFLSERAVSADDPIASGQSWRYERGLLAAEDLEAWLARRGVSVEEWLAWNGGNASVYVHGVCSGAFDRFAFGLAARLSVTADAPPDAPLAAFSPEPIPADIVVDPEIVHAERVFRASDPWLVPERVVREICTANAVDWLGFDVEGLLLETASAAREAMLCVDVDGQSLTEVGATVSASPVRRITTLSAFAEEDRPRLLAAREGALAGPLRSSVGFEILKVHARIPPDPSDPAVRARALEIGRKSAIQRAIAQHVRWLRWT